MPLFDFDYEWDWDEYYESIPKQIPFVGPWIGRAGGEWWPYWNMSEEDLAAAFTVGVYGGAVAGGAAWGAVNMYEFYRALQTLRFVATNPPAMVLTATVIAAQHNVTAPPPPEYRHQNTPWYYSVAQALTGGFGVGTWIY